MSLSLHIYVMIANPTFKHMLKKLFFLFFLAGNLTQTWGNTEVSGFVQFGNPIIEAINRALNTGDVDALSQYFGTKVEIAIAEDEQTYDKVKAKEVLKAFFSANKPSGYASMHSGKSKESSDQYCIGNLTTSNGTYRVYVYLKTTGTTQTIQELRFDQ
jgi:hypothetical protein